VPVIRVDIPGTTTDGVIVYFHGGFFAIGSAATSVGLAAGGVSDAHDLRRVH
jgi:epsilon-lactone hydrolase